MRSFLDPEGTTNYQPMSMSASTGTATLSTGDANGDMNVDGLDLQVWSQQFGQVATVSIAMPEPAIWLLLLAGCVGAGRTIGRRNRQVRCC